MPARSDEDQKSDNLIKLEKRAVEAFLNKDFSDDAESVPDEPSSKSQSQVSVDTKYQRNGPSPSRKFEKNSSPI